MVPPREPRLNLLRVQRTQSARRHLRGIRIVLNIFLALALLYTVTITSQLLIPLVLASFIGLALNPVVARCAHLGIPRWLGASVLMVGLIAAIGAGVGMLTQPALGWVHEAPTAIRSFMPKLHNALQPLEAANRATQGLTGPTRVQGTAQSPLSITIWDVVATTPKVLAGVLTVVLLVFFFLVYGDLMLRRLVEASPSFGYKRHAVSVVRGIQYEVSRYILTATLINVALGAVTAGMLWLYHMPDPLLWGTVAMLANFIPYVGAISTTAVLAVVGLLNFNQAGAALLPALTFAGITAFEGNLVTPFIQGHRMRLSPIAILLWLLVWGWLWGIPGALLAVPMLTSAKLVAERVRGWRWFARMVQR
ncbi:MULTISPECIES: AI-2E family transporter [unclassified Dyella]|uniref:AI-2E family transporter n=1 Tax=unclassified Dyella TaxID=2634549 RepID=UPI000C849D2E|nr:MULTISPECIES: AI-2E family transporter [unclassified Dyella]MDR3443950.1 AI-2E family transporter [Dyella sp.]